MTSYTPPSQLSPSGFALSCRPRQDDAEDALGLKQGCRAPEQSPDRADTSRCLGAALGTGAPIATALQSGLRYGVEVEHQGLSFERVGQVLASTLGRATYNDANKTVEAKDGRIWSLVSDAGGVEVVTPVLQGSADLAMVQAMVSALRAAGGITNSETGLHVHVDAEAFEIPHVQRLIALMARHENWLYPVWAVHPDRRQNFCGPIDRAKAMWCVERADLTKDDVQSLGLARYHGLNLKNYYSPIASKYTIEFRYLNGTLDPAMVGCAVGFYTRVADYALQRCDQQPALPVRSSLPVLLRELCVPAGHPIDVQFRDMVGRRITEGWIPHKHGPLPDVPLLVNDDGFVGQLCELLNCDSDARDVAGAAHLILHTSAPELQQLVTGAEELVARISRALDTPHLSLPALVGFMSRHPGHDDALLRVLRELGCYSWSASEVERAIQIMLPHVAAHPDHLDAAIRWVKASESDFAPDRLDSLQERLCYATERLQGMAALIDAWGESYVTPVLIRMVDGHTREGDDMYRLYARLPWLGRHNLKHSPEACVLLMRALGDHDADEVLAFAQQPAMASWSADEQIRLTTLLLPWSRRPGADLTFVFERLAQVTVRAGHERLVLAGELIASPDVG